MLSSITRASVKPTQMASRAFISTWNAVPMGKFFKSLDTTRNKWD